MIDPNVLNYFLVILGGFGVVWSYRHARKQNNYKISEFEYAAFSALWGIPVFLLSVYLGKPGAELWDTMFKIPMLTTPFLFFIGVVMGLIGAKFMSLIHVAVAYLKMKLAKS